MGRDGLKKEDYEEPRCPEDCSMWQENAVKPIDIRRVIEKLDEYFYKNDTEAALKHLDYWLAEAREGNDKTGEFQIENELMGLCRKLGYEDDAKAHAKRALLLIDVLGIGDNTGAATAYVNAATVFQAFGDAAEAEPLFEKARRIYEERLSGGDPRLGGLYNNMALAKSDLNKFTEALELYKKALSVMEKVPEGYTDMAVTYLNMADSAAFQLGIEAALPLIEEYCERAWRLLSDERCVHDSYYGFVCGKCAPSFEHYGYIEYAEKMRERAGMLSVL